MYFLYFVDRTNFAIAGPAMRADLGLSNTDLGILFAAFGIPYALLSFAATAAILLFARDIDRECVGRAKRIIGGRSRARNLLHCARH